MVVRCKEEVYNWFRTLDSSNRIDFFCTLLSSYCNPWEIRFFGTCLEHVARTSHHVLKEYDFQTSDYTELQARMLQSPSDILDQKDDLRRLVMCIALLKSRPPNASCSTIASNIIMEIHRSLQLRLESISSPTDLAKTQLIDDIRLLLAIAIHHPAFSFHDRELFKDQLDGISKIFGLTSADDSFSKQKDAECQTESTKGCCYMAEFEQDATSPKDAPLVNSLLIEGHSAARPGQYHINDLKLISTPSCKSEVIYKIEVRYNNGQQLFIEKSHQDIKLFHDKMLAAFPDDARSPKHIRNIPLLKPHDGRDSVQRYIGNLCKMEPKFLHSQTMLEFFLPSTHLPNSDSLSKSSVIMPKDARTVVDEDEETSESESLTLPMQTVIVTNSSKYSLPAPSLKVTTGHSQAKSPTGACVPSSQMLQMSKSELKARGMVDGAVKKLTDKLDGIRSTEKLNNHEFKDQAIGKPGYVKAGYLHSSGSNNREEFLFLDHTPAQNSVEVQNKSDAPLTDLQPTLSSSNLYAFPTSQSMAVISTAPIDTSQKKSPRETRFSHSTDDTHTTRTVTAAPASHSSAAASLHSSTKANKRSTKSSSFSQHSPRTSMGDNKPQNSPHSGSRQRNEPKGLAASSVGKPLTVEEIKQRQRQQHAMQRQQSGEAYTQSHKNFHSQLNSKVCHVQQPSVCRSLSPAQHQTVAHVSVSSLPAQPIHSKQVTGPAQSSVPQSQGADNQQVVTQPEISQQHKIKITQSMPTTQPHSLPNSLSPDNAQGSPECPCAETSDESDGLTATDHDMSENIQGRSKLLKVVKPSEPLDRPTDTGKRRTNQAEAANESGDSKESVGTGLPSTVVLQQSFPPGAMDEMQYISVNGYKGYSFPQQDMDRVIYSGAVVPEGAPSFVSNNCTCPKCTPGYYVSIPGGPPPRPSHSPSPMPPQHQNGIVYGFTGGFIPPSNGMINPGMHGFNRPNGMVQRNDVVYQQVPFMPPNTSRQGYPTGPAPHFQQPSGYNPFYPSSAGYKKRVLHCTNCGMSNHTRNECPEPVDTSASINEYRLEMQPRPEHSD